MKEEFSQLIFTASQIFKNSGFRQYKFMNSKENSKAVLVSLTLTTNKKELPEALITSLRSKDINILGETRFIVNSSGQWRAVFNIYEKKNSKYIVSEKSNSKTKNIRKK